MSYYCARCPDRGRCVRCRRRNTAAKAQERARPAAVRLIAAATEGPEADPWLLCDDGIYDHRAVWIAAHGMPVHRVRLTYRERVAAATMILLRSGTARDVCVRLALPRTVGEVAWKSQQNSEGNSGASVA